MFRNQLGYSKQWPPCVQQLMEYIAYLSQEGYAYRTAGCHIAAIGFSCKINGLTDTTQAFVVRKMLDGMKRLQNRSDTRKPINIKLLYEIIDSLRYICSSAYDITLFSVAFQIAFFGLLRISEIQFRNRDITLFKHGMHIHLISSKTDQLCNGTKIEILFTEDTTRLRADALKYTEIRPKVEGQYLIHSNGLELTQFQFRNILHKSLTLLGHNQKDFQTHSFRIGGATYLFLKGKSDNEIQKSGRWRSNVYKKYIRL